MYADCPSWLRIECIVLMLQFFIWFRPFHQRLLGYSFNSPSTICISVADAYLYNMHHSLFAGVHFPTSVLSLTDARHWCSLTYHFVEEQSKYAESWETPSSSWKATTTTGIATRQVQVFEFLQLLPQHWCRNFIYRQRTSLPSTM